MQFFTLKSQNNNNSIAICSGSYDKLLRIWEIDTGKLISTLTGHELAVSCLAVTKNGEFIASGSFDNTVRIWTVAQTECMHILYAH